MLSSVEANALLVGSDARASTLSHFLPPVSRVVCGPMFTYMTLSMMICSIFCAPDPVVMWNLVPSRTSTSMCPAWADPAPTSMATEPASVMAFLAMVPTSAIGTMSPTLCAPAPAPPPESELDEDGAEAAEVDEPADVPGLAEVVSDDCPPEPQPVSPAARASDATANSGEVLRMVCSLMVIRGGGALVTRA